ncbi:MAG: DUF4838 domain-containing protein [Limnochordia bacterium]|jgi:hypothetical protein
MLKYSLVLSGLVAAVSLLCGVAKAADLNRGFIIADNEQAEAQIVIGANAADPEWCAAEELQRAIQKMTGVKVPINEEPQHELPFHIIIGTPQSSAAVKDADLFETDSPEEVRVVRRRDRLYLAGPTPSAALYATYTFLQDCLGVRWFWPGLSGEYMPRLERIVIEELDIRHVPSLAVRSLAINSPHYDESTMIWMARNRMNVHNLQGSAARISAMKKRGFQVVKGGHNAVLPQQVLDANPEYMAEYGGKRQKPASRPPHLCWSNPDVQKAMAKVIAEWWDTNPEMDRVRFFGADHNHFCECEACQAYASDVSTRWQKFSGAVIELVNQTHPGKQYETLAYQAYRDVPTEAAPFYLIGYTTYNINYTKPITDPSNAKVREEIQAWQDLGVPMGIRGYQFINFNEPMLSPITSVIIEEIAWAERQGLKGWTSEVTPFGWPSGRVLHEQNWVTNRMPLYAAAQAMWNAQVRAGDIIYDWASYVFGPAAAPMAAYYELMDQAWRSNPEVLTYFLHPPTSFASTFISRELLQRADEYLRMARQALGSISDDEERERIETQINLEAAMLDKWRQTYLLQQGRATHFEVHVPRATVKPAMNGQSADPAWQRAVALPAFEDNKGNEAAEATEAYALWDENALYLRFINHDAQIEDLKISGEDHDASMFGDDGIELFLADPNHPAAYSHLFANAGGVRYDAHADGTMSFDVSYDPDWKAIVDIEGSTWILDIELPLESFGIKPTPPATGIFRFPTYAALRKPTTWKMSFKRSGAGRRPNTGWPDASYHNPASFGTITLVDAIPEQKRLILYDVSGKGDPKRAEALTAEMAKIGFDVTAVPSTETELISALNKGTEVVVLRHPSGSRLSDELMNDHLKPFLQDGGMVLIAATGAIHFEKWFGSESGVQWSGWAIHPNRVTAWHDYGEWQRQPQNLTTVIEKRITPSSGYRPLTDSWTVMARLRMADETEAPYLMRLEVGKGTLYLTSSNLGYGGGHEMFGSQNPTNAAMLIDNLLAAHRRK